MAILSHHCSHDACHPLSSQTPHLQPPDVVPVVHPQHICHRSRPHRGHPAQPVNKLLGVQDAPPRSGEYLDKGSNTQALKQAYHAAQRRGKHTPRHSPESKHTIHLAIKDCQAQCSGTLEVFCHCPTVITQFLTCRRIGFSGGGIMALCSGCRHVWWRLHSIGATSSV